METKHVIRSQFQNLSILELFYLDSRNLNKIRAGGGGICQKFSSMSLVAVIVGLHS